MLFSTIFLDEKNNVSFYGVRSVLLPSIKVLKCPLRTPKNELHHPPYQNTVTGDKAQATLFD